LSFLKTRLRFLLGATNALGVAACPRGGECLAAAGPAALWGPWTFTSGQEQFVTLKSCSLFLSCAVIQMGFLCVESVTLLGGRITSARCRFNPGEAPKGAESDAALVVLLVLVPLLSWERYAKTSQLVCSRKN